MDDNSTPPINVDPRLLQRVDTMNRHYGNAIDEDQLENWPTFFTHDARYMVTTRQNHEAGMPVGLILCENRAMMEDRISALRIANLFEPHTYRHLIDPPVIKKQSGNVYSMQTNLVCFRTVQSSGPEIFCTGKYLDKIIDEAGTLLFKERIVVCDSERIDTLIVIPI